MKIINKKDIIKILSNYDIGTYKSHEYFTAGCVQINIKVNTTKNTYALRIYRTRTIPYVKYEFNVLNYLSKKKYPTPLPIRNLHGKFIFKYNKYPVGIFSFIEGKHIKKLNKVQYKDLIFHLAKLHNITSKYKPKYGEHRESLDHKYVLSVIKKEIKKFNNSLKGKKRYNFVIGELKKTILPKSLPKGVIHGDYCAGNILFGKRINGVIDFDNACYNNLIYDLAFIIYDWTSFKENDNYFEESKKIINLYQEIRPLNNVEKKYLFDQLKIICLVYTGWFFYDSINKESGRDIFEKSKERIERLNEIGRKEFYKKMFEK